MGDIARPALAEVLAAITDRPVGHWRAEIASPAFLGVERISSTGVRWSVRVDPFRSKKYPRHAPLRSTEPAYEARRVGNTLTRVEVSPAHTITPAEAVEALAGLWPWEPGDERAPRWWCDGCEGTGLAAVDTARGRKVYRCGECDIAGHTADPPTLAALVAVASLGAGRLARYVHLAGEIARAAGCAGASVVWRPIPRDTPARNACSCRGNRRVARSERGPLPRQCPTRRRRGAGSSKDEAPAVQRGTAGAVVTRAVTSRARLRRARTGL